MTNNYIKVIGKAPSIYLERAAGFGELEVSKQVHELFFFDGSDAMSTSAAEQRVRAFRARQAPGYRMQVSVYRPCSSLMGIPEVGAPPEQQARRVA